MRGKQLNGLCKVLSLFQSGVCMDHQTVTNDEHTMMCRVETENMFGVQKGSGMDNPWAEYVPGPDESAYWPDRVSPAKVEPKEPTDDMWIMAHGIALGEISIIPIYIPRDDDRPRAKRRYFIITERFRIGNDAYTIGWKVRPDDFPAMEFSGLLEQIPWKTAPRGIMGREYYKLGIEIENEHDWLKEEKEEDRE